MSITAATVQATDLPDNCSYDDSSYPIVKFEGSWPSAAITAAQDGFGWWKNTKDLNGNPAIKISYGWHGDTRAYWVDYGPGWGIGLCGSKYMHFYANNIGVYATSNVNFFRSIAAHEFGHVLGLGHTGKYDSWDGVIPIMATNRGQAWLSQDDRSGIQAVKHEDKSLNKFWPTPNASFEDGTSYWERQSLNWSVNSYGKVGSKSLRITPTGSAPHRMWTEARLLDNQGHDIDMIWMNSYVKKLSGTYRYVTLAMNVGRVTYTHGQSEGYPIIEGWDNVELNQNIAASVTWTAWHTVDCYPTTSWEGCFMPAKSKPSQADGVDLVAYVYPRMYVNGTTYHASVDIDSTSVTADF